MAQIQFSKGIDEEVVLDAPHPFAGWQQWHCNVLFPKSQGAAAIPKKSLDVHG